MTKHIFSSLFLTLLVSISVQAQPSKAKVSTGPPGLGVITLDNLKRDLHEMADDHFRGRESGTLDELKSSVWWADKMRAAGLKPAGDDGTFFQFFSLQRNRVSPTSKLTIGDQNLRLWTDVLIAQTAPCAVEAPLVFVKDLSQPVDVNGKAVVIQSTSEGINTKVSIPEWRYHRAVLTKYGNDLLAKGAAAIIFVSDDFAEHSWPYAQENMKRGLYDISGGPNAKVAARPPVLWLHKAASSWLKEGQFLKATINLETFEYPSVNIVGKIEGTNPSFAREYVLFSGHQDAHGIRNIENGDSIYHGADDNASVNAAMLAVARAFKKAPTRRSVLFVFHGAEERGLMGSKWYSAHPTVPLYSIIAVLNGDMIGRNHPDSAALMGSQAAHRNSDELVNLALQANKEGPKFKLDTLWDKSGHVEFWYFRSDHLPYARLGVPAIMYTSLLNKDYHTPRDDAKGIDYNKLKKMADWIYRTGYLVANAPDRPKVNPGFKLER